MLRQLKRAGALSIYASVVMSGAAPIPVSAMPNCNVEAYLACKDGKWQGDYASEAQCREIEKDLCTISSGNPGTARCWDRGPSGWYPSGNYPIDC